MRRVELYAEIIRAYLERVWKAILIVYDIIHPVHIGVTLFNGTVGHNQVGVTMLHELVAVLLRARHHASGERLHVVIQPYVIAHVGHHADGVLRRHDASKLLIVLTGVLGAEQYPHIIIAVHFKVHVLVEHILHHIIANRVHLGQPAPVDITALTVWYRRY